MKRKKAVVTLFEGLSRQLLGRREYYEKRQDSRSPNRDLSLGPPKHEAGVLSTRYRRWVSFIYSKYISFCINGELIRTI
jgi:hypothetical protein